MYLEGNSVCSFDFFIDRINIANTSKFKLKIFIMDYSTSFNIDNSSVTYPIDTVMDGIKNFTVDLSDYAYKTVKIIILMDFQVSEKFTSHLGNLYVRQASICSITEEICPTTVYTKNGFDIVDEQLQTPGTYRYTKEIENSEGVDSIASLILKVMNRKDNIINYRICPGETVYYKDIPFTEEGSSYFYYTSTQGCDSADVVQIVHMPTYDYIDYQYIVPELLPYSYGDTVFNRDTPYGIYHYRQELKSSEGCDSIVTLELSVQKELSVSEPSCFYIETYPNPQQVGESITLIANNMQESHFPCKVELFNSVGTLITQTEVTMFPTKIYGMNQSGVYMLRVTTAKNTVVYQKIIIK